MIDFDVFELAACRGADPELMFPWAAPGTEAYGAQVAEAKAVCAVCPVRHECADYVFAVEDPARRFGVWAGLDPDERTALVAERVAERDAEVPVAV